MTASRFIPWTVSMVPALRLRAKAKVICPLGLSRPDTSSVRRTGNGVESARKNKGRDVLRSRPLRRCEGLRSRPWSRGNPAVASLDLDRRYQCHTCTHCWIRKASSGRLGIRSLAEFLVEIIRHIPVTLSPSLSTVSTPRNRCHQTIRPASWSDWLTRS